MTGVSSMCALFFPFVFFFPFPAKFTLNTLLAIVRNTDEKQLSLLASRALQSHRA